MCKFGIRSVQQVADQTANGSLKGLLDWIKVRVTNKSKVKLHMLDRELLSVHAIYDAHSHLDRWSVEVGKREAREHQTAMPYETVTSYCFFKWWGDHVNRLFWIDQDGRSNMMSGVFRDKNINKVNS